MQALKNNQISYSSVAEGFPIASKLSKLEYLSIRGGGYVSLHQEALWDRETTVWCSPMFPRENGLACLALLRVHALKVFLILKGSTTVWVSWQNWAKKQIYFGMLPVINHGLWKARETVSRTRQREMYVLELDSFSSHSTSVSKLWCRSLTCNQMCIVVVLHSHRAKSIGQISTSVQGGGETWFCILSSCKFNVIIISSIPCLHTYA